MTLLLLTVITLGLANLTPTNVVLPNQCWGNQSRIKTTSQKGQSCILPLNQEDAGDEVEAIVKVGRDDSNIGNILVYRTGDRNYVLVSQFYPECLTTGYLSTKLRKSPLTRSCCIPSAGIDNIICGVHWVVELWNTSSDDKLTLKEACECLAQLKNCPINAAAITFDNFIKDANAQRVMQRLATCLLQASPSADKADKDVLENADVKDDIQQFTQTLFDYARLNNTFDNFIRVPNNKKTLRKLIGGMIIYMEVIERLAKEKNILRPSWVGQTFFLDDNAPCVTSEYWHGETLKLLKNINQYLLPEETATEESLITKDEDLYYALKSVFNLLKKDESSVFNLLKKDESNANTLSQIKDYCNHAMHTEVQVMVAEAAFGWTTSLPVYSTKLPCWSCVRIPDWQHEFHAYQAGLSECEVPYYPVCFYVERQNQKTKPTGLQTNIYQLPKEQKGFDAQCTLHATTQNDVDYATKSRWTTPRYLLTK